MRLYRHLIVSLLGCRAPSSSLLLLSPSDFPRPSTPPCHLRPEHLVAMCSLCLFVGLSVAGVGEGETRRKGPGWSEHIITGRHNTPLTLTQKNNERYRNTFTIEAKSNESQILSFQNIFNLFVDKSYLLTYLFIQLSANKINVISSFLQNESASHTQRNL